MTVRSFPATGVAVVLVLGAAACGGKTAPAGPTIAGNTLTIYSSLPAQGAAGPQAQGIVNGAKLALSDAGGKVGKYTIRYVPLDDSTAAAGKADAATVAANARKAAADATTIGYLGEFNSGATKVSLPITNRAGIAQVSPASTYVGLTTDKAGSVPGEPNRYYPTGKRTFARVVPADDVQGAALATAAIDARCRSLEIWNSRTTYGAGLARNVEIAATKIVASARRGPAATRVPAPAHVLKIAGDQGIDPRATSYRSQAQTITARCFAYTGEIESNGARVREDVGAARPGVELFGGDALVSNELASPTTGLPPAIAARFHGTFPTLAPSQYGAAARRFLAEYSRTYNTTNPDPYAIYGYEAMALTLDAIRRAGASGDGSVSRAGVVHALLTTKNRRSALGTYSIDGNGDTTASSYGLYRIEGGRLVFDRVIEAPRLG